MGFATLGARHRVLPVPECASGLAAVPNLACSARASPARERSWRRDMKISARNQIRGKVVEVKTGATTAHVRVEIAGGTIVTAAITNEAVADLGLKAGASVIAVVKASDVMIATD